ncbi:hypothetical protein [Streptomyces sp. NPDC047315]|uniref:hypothetical protein n=1 Tax=Streptomyces sp. NPDC047315 TaxID=3155142 RepID=UPI0033E0AB19
MTRKARAMASHRPVTLTVGAEWEANFDKRQHLLPGYELHREPTADGTRITITMNIPDAPPEAASMTPWFNHDEDLPVDLAAIDYHDADGRHLTTWRPPSPTN